MFSSSVPVAPESIDAYDDQHDDRNSEEGAYDYRWCQVHIERVDALVDGPAGIGSRSGSWSSWQTTMGAEICRME